MNRAWLAERNIQYSGKPLERPPKLDKEKAAVFKLQQKLRKSAEFQAKLKANLVKAKMPLICILFKAKFPNTSESWIAAVFLVMNIAHLLRVYFFVPIFSSKKRSFQLFGFVKEHVWVTFTQFSFIKFILQNTLDNYYFS